MEKRATRDDWLGFLEGFHHYLTAELKHICTKTFRSDGAVDGVAIDEDTLPRAPPVCLENVDRLDGVLDLSLGAGPLHRHGCIHHHR